MTFIAGLITGLLVGGIAVRLIYNTHIEIADSEISAELARAWVERNLMDGIL